MKRWTGLTTMDRSHRVYAVCYCLDDAFLTRADQGKGQHKQGNANPLDQQTAFFHLITEKAYQGGKRETRLLKFDISRHLDQIGTFKNRCSDDDHLTHSGCVALPIAA